MFTVRFALTQFSRIDFILAIIRWFRKLIVSLLIWVCGGAFAIVLFLITLLNMFTFDSAGRSIPSAIKLGSSSVSESDSDLRYACALTIFKIEPDTIAKLESGRLDFLQSLKVGRGNYKPYLSFWPPGVFSSQTLPGPDLSAWRAGPIQLAADRERPSAKQHVTADGDTLWAEPDRGCSMERSKEDQRILTKVNQALEKGDAYYSTHSGGKGIIVLASKLGWALEYYNNGQ
jgi:hypothetical protein